MAHKRLKWLTHPASGGGMTTSTTNITTTINSTMMITVVTVMTDKALRRKYLGAHEKVRRRTEKTTHNKPLQRSR